jgi:hypothetical protein
MADTDAYIDLLNGVAASSSDMVLISARTAAGRLLSRCVKIETAPLKA